MYNPVSNDVTSKIVEVSGENKQKNLERVANSRTVIIENIALDLGLTSKELQRFFLKCLAAQGVKDMQIVDIDVETGCANNSVTVEVADQNMVEKMRKLDGVLCLGEKMKVRRVGEETT